VAGIFGELGINIVSVVAGPRRSLPGSSQPGRIAVFRADTIDPREDVDILERAGYAVLWPPGP
jgi:acetoin utilization protein AcuB